MSDAPARRRFRPEFNPILVKELRSRMRGWRAFAVLTVSLLVMAGISYLLYRVVLAATRYGSNMPVSPQIGQALFAGLVVVEMAMICFITPAITAGTISGEREKLTYDMLLATPLRPASVLWGKLLSALSYVFLLILGGVPMASLVFIYGGVAPSDMLKALVILVATAATVGVIGTFMSALLRRTVAATVLSYLAVLMLLIGPFFAYIMVGVLRQREPPRWLLIPNPVSALFSAFAPPPSMAGGSVGFLAQLSWALSGMLSIRSGELTGIPRPLYHYTLCLYGALSLALYGITTRLVRPSRRWRLRWRDALVCLACLTLLGGGVAIPFLLTADRYAWRLGGAPIPTPAPVMVEREVVVKRVVERVVPATPSDPERAPTPTETAVAGGATSTGMGALTKADQIAIYAAVVRQLYTVDHTFGDTLPNWPTVYLVGTTDDSVGDPNAPQAASQALATSLREGIAKAMADLPAEIVWVDNQREVPRGDRGEVVDGGAIFTLGNIHLVENRLALVAARVYFGPLGMGTQTYLVEQVDGVWQVVGTTGVRIVS